MLYYNCIIINVPFNVVLLPLKLSLLAEECQGFVCK